MSSLSFFLSFLGSLSRFKPGRTVADLLDRMFKPDSDEMDSLVAFLGREPTNKAFLESLLGKKN